MDGTVIELPCGDLLVQVWSIDVELVSGLNWSVKKRPHTNYAQAWNPLTKRPVMMHRLILGEPPSDQKVIVDHRDGNGLNNQRSNLRWVTKQENNCNRRSVGSSQFLGVSWNKRHRKWTSQIRKDGKRTHLGTFVSEIEAAKAYDAKAIQLHGEFANLNFPMEVQNG